MARKKFVRFTHADMLAVMDPLARAAGGQLSWSFRGNELVYQILFPQTRKFVRVFSTIDGRSMTSREKDADAIRVVYGQVDRYTSSTPRILRTQGWQDRLQLRVREAVTQLDVHPEVTRGCIYCGEPDLVSEDPPLCAAHAEFLPDGTVRMAHWE